MLQNIAPHRFDNTYSTRSITKEDYLLSFRRREVLLNSDDTIPQAKEFNHLPEYCYYLFRIDEKCYFCSLDSLSQEDMYYAALRPYFRRVDNTTEFILHTAFQLFEWYKDHCFCGRCGKPLFRSEKERALYCKECGNTIYPKISPAVIIALRNNDSILMSVYANREYKHYALLAGFVEIGETPEDTVIREVNEEVGLHVKNIQYYASQPWGIDSDLLLGYVCDVDGSTEITLEEDELASAEWVKREDIEEDLRQSSLTSTLMQAFRNHEI